jgi:hypothetical protein
MKETTMRFQRLAMTVHTFLLNTDIRVLVYIPMMIGSLIAILTVALLPTFYKSQLEFPLMSICFLIYAATGIPMIIKRETLTRNGRIIQGTEGVIGGVLIIVIFLILTAMSIVAWVLASLYDFGWNR